MKLKRMAVPGILVIMVALLWGFQAGAYGLFEGVDSGNCAQCHTSWPGSEHTTHTAAFGCATCHVGSPGDNAVVTSTCAGCHSSDAFFPLHGGLEAPNGDYCGYCHENVANENSSLSELRNIFE